MHRWFGPGVLALVLTALSALAPTGAAEADDAVIHLFNGKDLTNFYSYLAAPHGEKQPLGKNNDPRKVFTVVDGAIRVSGEVWGGLITEKEWGNYHLTVEYKWGEKTWAPREQAARDSGILLHCQGADGSFGAWMPAIECQMIEGGTGDLLILGTKEHPFRLTSGCEERTVGEGKDAHKELYFKEDAPAQRFAAPPVKRIDWWGRDPIWKDVKGFRGKQDVEKPVGQWNTLECVCLNDKITVLLNGKMMNQASQCSPDRGKILFQSEGAEVFFRKIDLKPLSGK